MSTLIFQTGDSVLVRLPNQSYYRSAIVDTYNPDEDVYTVTLVRGGFTQTVHRSHIKGSRRGSKATSEITNSPNLRNLNQTPPVIIPDTPMSQTSNIPENTNIRSPNSRSSDNSYQMDYGNFASENYKITGIKLISLMFLGYFTITILINCLNLSCNDFIALFLEQLQNFSPFFKTYTHIFCLSMLIVHRTLNCLLIRYKLRNPLTDMLTPFIASSLLYFTILAKLVDYNYVFSNMGGIVLFYFVLSLMISILQMFGIKYPKASPDNHIFIQQHSVFLMFLPMFKDVLNETYTFSEGLGMHVLFCFGVIILIANKIQDLSYSRHINYFSLLLARPFLLTIPILSNISTTPHQWHIFCYIPPYLVFMFCFIQLMGPRAFMDGSSLKTEVYSILTKVCMVSVTGTQWYAGSP